jgi:hypothetical protein
MTSISRLISAVAIAALVAGCGSDASTSPNGGPPPSGGNGGNGGNGGSGGGAGTPFDVAALVGTLRFATISGFPAARNLLSVPTPLAAPPFDATLCPFTAPAKSFICPQTNVDGMTFTTTFSLADSLGTAIAESNATNVATAHFIRDGKGTVYPPITDQGSAQIGVNDHSDMTVTGLASGPRRVNGTTTTHYDVLLEGTSATFRSSFDLTTTVANVELPATTASSPWPLSGTITSDMKGVTTSTANPVMNTNTHAVLTFNGTSMPTMVTKTISGSPVTCRVDLNGATLPVCP